MQSSITVVIPIYRPVFKYLKLALDSVVEQDYPKLEVIVSNDGESLEEDISTLLTSFYSRIDIKVINNNNAIGIFSNLNNAIINSSGDYIQLFCQDDVMKPNFLKGQIETIKDFGNVSMIFSGYDVIDENQEVITDLVNVTFTSDRIRLIRKEDAVITFLTYGCLPGNLSPVMLSRQIISSIGLFNQDYKYAGDFEYWIRVSEVSDIVFVPGRNLYVRKHANQATFLLPNLELVYDSRRIYGRLIEFLPKENQRKFVSYINKRVGTAFLHHFIKSIVNGRMNGEIRRLYFSELNIYPFRLSLAFLFYTLSLPKRLLRLI